MKKIVAIFTFSLFLFSGINAQVSNIKFGVEVSPFLSWLDATDNADVLNDGKNLGLKIGVIGDYFFTGNDNYSLSSGIRLAIKEGGVLQYNGDFMIANFFPDSDLTIPGIDSLGSGTRINYNLQFIEIPFSLKMKTKELGSSMLKVFAEAPIFTLGIRTQARAKVESPLLEGGSAEKLDFGPDTGILNLSWGLGGGVEFYPNDEQTAIVAGVYFQSGLFDSTERIEVDGITERNSITDPTTKLNIISLRLGIMF